jgi:copper(I)-binding protein
MPGAMKAIISVLALAILAVGAPAQAHQYRAGELHIAHPSSRPAAEGMNGVGYLTVTNMGQTPDVLLAVETPAAKRVEIHESSTAGGIMRMRRLRGGVPLPAKSKVVLGPAGTHLMMLKLKRPFAVADKVPATLVFKRAGRVEVWFLVQRDARAHGH